MKKINKIMGWKSTKTISRQELEKKIIEEISNIEKLSDDTLCEILETIGSDENSEIYSGYNYMIDGDDFFEESEDIFSKHKNSSFFPKE